MAEQSGTRSSGQLLPLAVGIGACLGLMLASAQAQTPPAELVEPRTGMHFVALPAGCFEMGDLDAGVVGRVCVAAFALGRTEVTNAEFRRFRPEHRSGSYNGQGLDDDLQPAVNVRWGEAVAFAGWLARESGRRLRLPSEAEWEYAARAGSPTAWPWGSSDEPSSGFANLRRRAGDPLPADPFTVTAPVGSLAPNAFGLVDMIGNASEWVLDAYQPSPARYGAKLDSPLVAGEGPLRVRRGGSFDDPPRQGRSAARDFYAAEFPVPQTGFRLLMEP